MSAIHLKHLAYFGQNCEPASINFESGLNVICGSSETGKSLIVESVDFMLGQEEPVRDIPERRDYDRIRLIIEGVGHSPLTLERSIEGGNFRAFNEALINGQPKTNPYELRWKHAATRTDTLSYQLLVRMDCINKVLRRNANGNTRSLSFRDIARLCVVTEEEIQRRVSPILSGQWVTSTSEYAAFKFLLTGIDDSSLVPAEKRNAIHDRDSGKAELLDQMIEELQAELDESGADEAELIEQELRLNSAIEARANSLQLVQQNFNLLVSGRADTAKELREKNARILEISELTKRFTLLDRHYSTDLERLRAIHEAGTLFVHLEANQCPLCGALPGNQHLDGECEGNPEFVTIAANAEISKIRRLRFELSETLSSLREEHSELELSLPSLQAGYDSIEERLREILAPAVMDERSSYNELLGALSLVRTLLNKIADLKKLAQRRVDLENNDENESGSRHGTKTLIPKSILDEFAQELQQILRDWDYPDASRVYFDEAARDIQISGRERGSTGKGLRAITHAAFTIGLMQFCRERGLPHPGFVVLDSPLLAYWKPEGEDDDLRGSSLKDNFYRYLLGMSKDNQIIIIENEHPPLFVCENAPVTVFTKNENVGRYGFFPPL